MGPITSRDKVCRYFLAVSNNGNNFAFEVVVIISLESIVFNPTRRHNGSNRVKWPPLLVGLRSEDIFGL